MYKRQESLGASLTVMNILAPLPNSQIYNTIKADGVFSYPDSIRGLAVSMEQRASDTVIVNLSKIPDRDLKVIHYFYQWKAFAGKSSVNNEDYGVIRKTAGDAINRIFKHGLAGFFYGTYSSVKQFGTVFFYSHMFSGILKKYGLK